MKLAREGFLISADLADGLNGQLSAAGTVEAARERHDFGRMADFPESVAAFGKPDGSPWQAGDRLVQADLAATLERIAGRAPTSFTMVGPPS